MFISDDFSLKDDIKLKTLATKNDIICLQVLDSQEVRGDFAPATTFCSPAVGWVQSGTTYASQKYTQRMQNMIAQQQQILRKIGVSPLLLTTQDDMIATLFRFFKTRQ